MKLMLSIWRKSPGEYFCISTKSPSGTWRDTFFKRREISKAVGFIKRKKSSDVYMSTHGFSKASRNKDFAEDPCLFYADLDECNPRDLAIKPTIAIQSSPGRYVGYWITDEPVPEELNRRLTYHIGADASGWDRSQVLRVPGTRNHKYDEKPLIKVLWDDGPRYELKRLAKMIPEIENEDGQVEDGDASEIYDKYEKHMPRWLRKEFINPRVQHGKRSEVLWKMISECLEIGMSKEETFTICWHNEWNKHAERRDGERQMWREIDKAAGRHVGGSSKKKSIMDKDEEDPTKSPYFSMVTMDKVEEEDLDWLVPQMIARGQTTIFEGDPGVGKSYFLMWLAVHFCDGKRLPWQDKHDPVEPLRVVYFDTENAMGAVTKGRLQDNGLKNGANYLQLQEIFSLDNEEAFNALEKEVVQGFKPDIVIVDPINPYLGGADSYNAKDVQQALQNLRALAEEYNFALILVRHLNKSKNVKALYAGGGSIGFAGLARVVATVGWHPEEPNVRVVACTKNNLSVPFGSLGYSIESIPDTLKRKNRSELVYEGRVDYTSDDIIATTNIKEDNSVDIASDLIRERMKIDGAEINYHSLLKQADTRSISEKSLKRAATELGLKKVSKGRGKTRQTFLVDQNA